MKKKGESTMILIMQYLDFNLPNFLLWTVMIFFTVYPLVIILCIIRRYKILMESLHIANLLDEKGKTLLKEIFPKKIREELKNSRKIDDKLSKKICHNLKWFYIWFLIYFIALFIYAIFTVINITTLIHMVRISADMSIFKNMEILVLFQVMLTGNLIIETLYPVIHMFFGYKHDKNLLNVLTPINFLIEDIVEKKLYPVIGYIARFFFASVLFFSYLQLIVYLCTKKQYSLNEIEVLIVLAIYQYGILKVSACILEKFTNCVFKKKNISFLRRYTVWEIGYMSIKNSSYVVMLGVYIWLSCIGKADSAVPLAINFLFLLDNAVITEDSIKKRIMN